MPEKKQYKCTECDQSFQSGQWTGCGGNEAIEHQVPKKIYYSRYDSFGVTVRIGKTVLSSDGQGTQIRIPGKRVRFRKGKFFTTDPEVQEFLDRNPNMLTVEEWTALRLSPKDIQARQARTIDEQSRLIAKLQADKAQLEAAKTPTAPTAEAN